MDWRCNTSDGTGPRQPVPAATRRTAVRPPAAVCAAPRALRLLGVVLLLALPLAAPPPAGAGTGLLSMLPAAWRDDQGQAFDLRTLHGHSVVLTMAYASCHRVCPLTLRRLERMQRALDERGGSAEFVVIGYDPEHDDAPAWHQYRATRHLTRSNWHFLTGTPAAVDETARRLGFGFWRYEQHVMHGLRIVRFDEHGALIGSSDGSELEMNESKHTEGAAP
jgi:cytochrome oxidase Cu insertion factor (SCO1/SenC/PrrC family)